MSLTCGDVAPTTTSSRPTPRRPISKRSCGGRRPTCVFHQRPAPHLGVDFVFQWFGYVKLFTGILTPGPTGRSTATSTFAERAGSLCRRSGLLATSTARSRCSSSCMSTTSRWPGKKESVKPMWANLRQYIELDPETPLVDHVYLEGFSTEGGGDETSSASPSKDEASLLDCSYVHPSILKPTLTESS